MDRNMIPKSIQIVERPRNISNLYPALRLKICGRISLLKEILHGLKNLSWLDPVVIIGQFLKEKITATGTARDSYTSPSKYIQTKLSVRIQCTMHAIYTVGRWNPYLCQIMMQPLLIHIRSWCFPWFISDCNAFPNFYWIVMRMQLQIVATYPVPQFGCLLNYIGLYSNRLTIRLCDSVTLWQVKWGSCSDNQREDILLPNGFEEGKLGSKKSKSLKSLGRLSLELIFEQEAVVSPKTWITLKRLLLSHNL